MAEYDEIFAIMDRLGTEDIYLKLKQRIYRDVEAQVRDNYKVKLRELIDRDKELHHLNKVMWEKERERRQQRVEPVSDLELLQRGITLSIFNTLVDQIAMWHESQPIAEDFVNLSRSFLFPKVYEPVMEGDSAYYLKDFPNHVEDIVFLGRQLIHEMRQLCPTHVNTSTTWDEWQPRVVEWWRDIALPAIYNGESDPTWGDGAVYTHREMNVWNTDELTRALHFGVLCDMSGLTEGTNEHFKYFTSNADFVRKSMETRLTD